LQFVGKIRGMPILKHAKKKLRSDLVKKRINKIIKSKAVNLLDKARKEKGQKNLTAVFSALDRAAKRKIFHRRKADRLKSRLAKLISKTK